MSAAAMDIGLLVLRVAIGVTFVAHGYNHLGSRDRFVGTAKWFASLGMRLPKLQALLASVTEIGAGLLLVLGFLTPLAAGALAGTMVVAFMIAHRTNGFFIFRPGQGWEYVMNLFVACIAVGAMGAGQWSLDDVFGITYGGALTGLWIALAVSVGGAGVLLATCWRPPRPTSSTASG